VSLSSLFIESHLIKNHGRVSEAFGTTWTKQYCMYHKDTKEVTLIPYNQITGKIVSIFLLRNSILDMKLHIDVYFILYFSSHSAQQKPSRCPLVYEEYQTLLKKDSALTLLLKESK
jgi:hypothetical protein